MSSVSIIIPTMNRRDLLREALDSLARQTRPCTEAIVIDAGADGSDELAARYPFVRYHRQVGKGLTAARNQALALARGGYIGMLDSDDFYEPTFLERCCEALDRNPTASLVYTRGFSISEEGERLGLLLAGHRPRSNALAGLVDDNYVIASLCLMRRSALDRVGPYDESLGMADDYDLVLRLALLGDPMVHVPEPLASRRKHTGSLTLCHPERNLKIVRGILTRHQPALLRALGRTRPTWLAGIDYRLGRLALERGEIDAARTCFQRAWQQDRGHWRALVYWLWAQQFPWLDPVARRLRRWLRSVRSWLARLGLGEARWS